jgi:hypothetical protein
LEKNSIGGYFSKMVTFTAGLPDIIICKNRACSRQAGAEIRVKKEWSYEKVPPFGSGFAHAGSAAVSHRVRRR